MSEFAGRSVGTESNKVSFAYLLFSVPFLATSTVFTEALGVGDAIFGGGLLVDV